MILSIQIFNILRKTQVIKVFIFLFLLGIFFSKKGKRLKFKFLDNAPNYSKFMILNTLPNFLEALPDDHFRKI